MQHRQLLHLLAKDPAVWNYCKYKSGPHPLHVPALLHLPLLCCTYSCVHTHTPTACVRFRCGSWLCMQVCQERGAHATEHWCTFLHANAPVAAVGCAASYLWGVPWMRWRPQSVAPALPDPSAAAAWCRGPASAATSGGTGSCHTRHIGFMVCSCACHLQTKTPHSPNGPHTHQLHAISFSPGFIPGTHS